MSFSVPASSNADAFIPPKTAKNRYSLQNHLRTTVPEMGQVETDELYVGVDKKGIHYVFPVQAKGGTDKLSIVQIEQDFAVCARKFPALLCRPVAAQFMPDGVIALFGPAVHESFALRQTHSSCLTSHP